MKPLEKQTIFFLSEQDGKVEREFKEALCLILSNSEKLIRAYLARVKYEENDNSFNVALCFKTANGTDKHILNQSIEIFKSMFGSKEHLDIIFINKNQENELRNICCPFFTSNHYQIDTQDFFLYSTESNHIKHSIACSKNKRLYGEHLDGYLLCDINPPLIGQHFGMDGKDVTQVILASRHKGYSLFPIKEWPAYVHVAIPLINLMDMQYLQKSDIKHIIWAELYKNEKDIKQLKQA